MIKKILYDYVLKRESQINIHFVFIIKNYLTFYYAIYCSICLFYNF